MGVISLGNSYYPNSFSYYENCSNSGTISPKTDDAMKTNGIVGKIAVEDHVIIE